MSIQDPITITPRQDPFPLSKKLIVSYGRTSRNWYKAALSNRHISVTADSVPIPHKSYPQPQLDIDFNLCRGLKPVGFWGQLSYRVRVTVKAVEVERNPTPWRRCDEGGFRSRGRPKGTKERDNSRHLTT